MGTACNTVFTYPEGNPAAVVYRHWDGYPEGAGKDLGIFLERCADMKDGRLYDPAYLAARYVVYLANIYREDGEPNPLNFLSVGIVPEPESYYPSYIYTVVCGDDEVVVTGIDMAEHVVMEYTVRANVKV